jgi:hypothetical protein
VQAKLLALLNASILACILLCKPYVLHMTLLYAVLTGDLIRSTKASPLKLEATMANIADTARLLSQYTGEDTKFTRFRGDGWQLVLSPAFYLRAVALISARLKADRQTLQTRFGIGIGTVESFGATDLRDAHGTAFEHSGHALDSLTRDQAIMLAGGAVAELGQAERAERLRGAIEWSDAALLPMFGFITRRWSQAQSEAIAIALENDNQTQATIAAKLGITRQALNLRLTGAGYGPIHNAIKLTELYFRDTTNEGEQDR